MDTSQRYRHGALGITSFAVSLVVIVISFLDLIVAGYMKASGQTTDAVNVVVGLVLIFCGLLVVISIGLGIAGLLDRSSKKAFSVLGLCLSIGLLIIIIGIIILGLIIQARQTAG